MSSLRITLFLSAIIGISCKGEKKPKGEETTVGDFETAESIPTAGDVSSEATSSMTSSSSIQDSALQDSDDDTLATSTTSASTSDFTATDHTDTGLGTFASESSTSTGDTECLDPQDASPFESESTKVPSQDCSQEIKSFTGVLAAADDVDWFSYEISTSQPDCQIPDISHSGSGSGSIRLCIFALCNEGDETSIKCNNNSEFEKSPLDLAGCCSIGTAADAELQCSRSRSTEATVYIRIDNPNPNACLEYQIDYFVSP